MKWYKKSETEPILKRILVISKDTAKMHIVHYDYDWVLSETDNGFPGESIDFEYWAPLPKPPIEELPTNCLLTP